MKAHLDPLDPNQSTLRPSIQRISELTMSLNPNEETTDPNEVVIDQIRWAIQTPERVRQFIRTGQRNLAERDVGQLEQLLGSWDNVQDAIDLVKQCKAALALEQ